MKFKRNLYIAIIALLIYFALAFSYKKFILKDGYSYVYSLCKNVSRGDRVIESDLAKIKISSNNINKYLTVYTGQGYYRDDYVEGSIVLNNMILSNDEYIKIEINSEIISIKLNSAEDAGSYQIEKGSIINIFYSAKLSEIASILNSIDKTSVISNNLQSGYVTLKLLENVKIISCYDKYGNVTKIGNVAETILIEISKEESIKINNLKNYGKFSISIIKWGGIMNILFIYNLENKEFDSVSLKIEESIKNIMKDTIINVFRKDKINYRLKPDIYVILSDNHEEVDGYFTKIKDKKKSIVLTNNISSSNILSLIENTKNVCYMKNDIEILVRKIYNVYIESKENYV